MKFKKIPYPFGNGNTSTTIINHLKKNYSHINLKKEFYNIAK